MIFGEAIKHVEFSKECVSTLATCWVGNYFYFIANVWNNYYAYTMRLFLLDVLCTMNLKMSEIKNNFIYFVP